DAGVLALDLRDQQVDVRYPLARLEAHQLRPRPVQVVREEEHLALQPLEAHASAKKCVMSRLALKEAPQEGQSSSRIRSAPGAPSLKARSISRRSVSVRSARIFGPSASRRCCGRSPSDLRHRESSAFFPSDAFFRIWGATADSSSPRASRSVIAVCTVP